VNKRILSLLIILILPALCIAQKADYRGCTWGDSKGTVKKNEGMDFAKETDTMILYTGRELGNYVPGNLIFIFQDDKLITIQWEYINPMNTQYLRSSLVEKYGSPDIASYALTQWTTKRTIITLTMNDTPFNFTVVKVKYTDASANIDNGF